MLKKQPSPSDIKKAQDFLLAWHLVMEEGRLGRVRLGYLSFWLCSLSIALRLSISASSC